MLELLCRIRAAGSISYVLALAHGACLPKLYSSLYASGLAEPPKTLLMFGVYCRRENSAGCEHAAMATQPANNVYRFKLKVFICVAPY